MARRRLSDLLREEANKPSEDTTAAAEVEPSTDEPEADAGDAAEETTTIASDSVPTKATTTAKGRATKRTEATEPEADSEPQQDDTVLQQITDLTTALEAQKETIAQLQTDLEQARKDARQLTDANAKLTEELKTLKAKKTAADNSALPVPTKLAPQELKLAPAPVEASETVEASAHPLNSFNRDVGWFD